MDRGKWIRVSLLLMLALTLAIPAMAQVRPLTLNDSQEPGSVIVFHKFIKGEVSLKDERVPKTEIEVGVVCPKGATCEQEQDVKIRFHWVCPGDQTFEHKYICKEVNFDAEVTVNGKLVFDPNGGKYPPPPCDRGYLIGWVIDVDTFAPIKFDGLIGDAVIRETSQDAAAYNAVPIQAYPGDLTGAVRTPGVGGSLINFDGLPGHYQAVTGREYCDVRFDKTKGSVETATSLTLLTLDVRSNRGNNPTFVDFNCYNEDEKLVSVSTEFICWTQVGLSRKLNGIPPLNSVLTEEGMGSRKGLCLSKTAEQLESPFGNEADVGPVTLLALVETLEFDGHMRLTAHSCYNDSVPVITTFYP